MKQKSAFVQPLLITSILMLLLSIFLKWPYGYYTLLRLVVFVTSGFVTIAAYKMQKYGWMIGVGLVTLLFNPIVPVHFDKATWRVIDFIVAVLFLILIFKIKSKRNSN